MVRKCLSAKLPLEPNFSHFAAIVGEKYKTWRSEQSVVVEQGLVDGIVGRDVRTQQGELA